MSVGPHALANSRLEHLGGGNSTQAHPKIAAASVAEWSYAEFMSRPGGNSWCYRFGLRWSFIESVCFIASMIVSS